MRRTRFKFAELFRVKHGYAFKSQFFEHEGPYALLTPGNFFEKGGFRNQGEKQKFYVGDVPEDYILEQGDLIVAMTEQAEGLLGSSAIVPTSNCYLHNQRLGLIVDLDESKIGQSYLYYLFNTRDVRHQISASASGTKVRHTSPGRIGEVVAELPVVAAQKRIANTLRAFDELIENNTRRTALLEQAARLLYEEWFVRLRFPGHEHTRILDGVPDGWTTRSLSDICSEVREHVDPSEVATDTPYIGLEHMPRRCITLSTWGRSADVTSTKHRYRAGEILFGKIRPYFHKVGFTLTDGVTSSDAIVIRPSGDDLRCLLLLTVSSDQFVRTASQTAREGSKMPRADWKVMQQYTVPLPPRPILEGLNDLVRPILKQLAVLTFQNQRAREARDFLLPRLMAGELEV